MDQKKNRHDLSRRDFLKIVGISTAATGVALTGCDSRRNAVSGDRMAQTEVPKDRMTYRTNPKQGQRVSLLGVWLYALADITGP